MDVDMAVVQVDVPAERRTDERKHARRDEQVGEQPVAVDHLEGVDRGVGADAAGRRLLGVHAVDDGGRGRETVAASSAPGISTKPVCSSSSRLDGEGGGRTWEYARPPPRASVTSAAGSREHARVEPLLERRAGQGGVRAREAARRTRRPRGRDPTGCCRPRCGAGRRAGRRAGGRRRRGSPRAGRRSRGCAGGPGANSGRATRRRAPRRRFARRRAACASSARRRRRPGDPSRRAGRRTRGTAPRAGWAGTGPPASPARGRASPRRSRREAVDADDRDDDDVLHARLLAGLLKVAGGGR